MPDVSLAFRRAQAEDVPDIVRMLADDPLGATRERDESPLPESYARVFRAIDGDPNNELVVACRGERVVGVLQLTYLPSLTYQGGWRALIEGCGWTATSGHRGSARPSSSGRSRGPASAAATWYSSPPTRPAPTPCASTRPWASSPRTRA